MYTCFVLYIQLYSQQKATAWYKLIINRNQKYATNILQLIMLRHTNTYSKADFTDKQLSQEQKHGQQYFLDIRPHKLFAVEMYLVTKRFCRA